MRGHSCRCIARSIEQSKVENMHLLQAVGLEKNHDWRVHKVAPALSDCRENLCKDEVMVDKKMQCKARNFSSAENSDT